MSKEELFHLCKKYGQLALYGRRKFIGLLPEVYRTKLYAEKGFSSIYEFAAKLAGVSKEQVNRVLNLEHQFEDKPNLREALVTGEVSSNKLAKIASIATPENEQFLLVQTKALSCRSLETLVRDEKTAESKNESALQKPLFEENLVHVNKSPELILANDVKQKLLEMQRKRIDFNEFLRECLERRDLEIAQEKEEITNQPTKTAKRYISVKIRKLLSKEHGTKCAIPGCNKPSREIHHAERFFMSQSHNPHYLAPLCPEHHDIAHSIDLKVQYFKKKAH